MTVPTYDQPLTVGDKISRVWYRFFQSIPGATTAYTTQPFSSSIVPAASNVRVLATGDFTLGLPTSSSDGAVVNYWITGSGVTVNVSLRMGAGGYVIPTSSSLTSPFSVPNGTKTRLSVQFDAYRSAWEVVQYINGY